MIIGFAGKAGSGKSTLAKHIAQQHDVPILSFAEPIKRIGQELYRLSNEQVWGDLKDVVDPRWGITPRYIFQQIGEAGRKIHEDTWVRALDYHRLLNGINHFVVDDVRHANEVHWLHSIYGIVIQINRVDSYDLGAGSQHESEVMDFRVNYYIDNDKAVHHAKDKVNDIVLSRYGGVLIGLQ